MVQPDRTQMTKFYRGRKFAFCMPGN